MEHQTIHTDGSWLVSFESLRISNGLYVADDQDVYEIKPISVPVGFVRWVMGIVIVGAVISAYFFPFKQEVTWIIVSLFAVVSGLVTFRIFEWIVTQEARQGPYLSLDKRNRILSLATSETQFDPSRIIAFGEIRTRDQDGINYVLTVVKVTDAATGLETTLPVIGEFLDSSRSVKWPPKGIQKAKKGLQGCGQKLADFFDVPLKQISAMDLSAIESEKLLGI